MVDEKEIETLRSEVEQLKRQTKFLENGISEAITRADKQIEELRQDFKKQIDRLAGRMAAGSSSAMP